MELVGKDVLPSFRQPFLTGKGQIPAFAEGVHHRKPLCFPVQKLHLPVHPLIERMAGIGTAMVFQIQLPVPGIYKLVGIFHRLLQLFKIVPRSGGLDVRKAGNFVQTSAHFQHIPVYAAAPVPEAVRNQQVPVHVLFAVSVPDALDGFGQKPSVIGIKPAARLAVRFRRGNEMGQHFAAVDPLPVEGIVGHPVILVPADLGGHKHVDAGFFQDLGQGPGIAEHVRKPQIVYVLSELFLDEAASQQDLPGQRLAAGQVAVRFHPHGAVGFPAAFFHLFPDGLIQLREIFFHIFVQLGLGLQENIFREHLHHPHYRGKRAGAFFPGVL